MSQKDLIIKDDWEDKEFEKELNEEPFDLLPRDNKKHILYRDILKNLLPYLGSDEGKIVLTEVMIALKIEGVIGTKLNTRDAKMVHTIKESILIEPEKKQQALKFAEQLLIDEKKDGNITTTKPK